MINLTQEEINFMLQVLDQVQLRGIDAKRMVLDIMEKLAAELVEEDGEVSIS